VNLRHAAAVATELALCGVIGLSGALMIWESVHALRCGEGEAADAAFFATGSFLLGLAAWEWRRG
jgi:hypothetical protein